MKNILDTKLQTPSNKSIKNFFKNNFLFKNNKITCYSGLINSDKFG